MKIVCAGHLVRYPLGGHVWHHLQYLVGLRRLGHQVLFVEDYGWPQSCYDPVGDIMTADPTTGIAFLCAALRPYGLDDRWCYLAEDGAAHGMTRGELADVCRDADLYLNLSNVNWIAETLACRRRVLVDTDPVFTQIGAHGLSPSFEAYHALFTYGENIHKPGCEVPAAGQHWLPTRQPVVLDLWPVTEGGAHAPFTTVMNWTTGERESGGRRYGRKDREFTPFFALPRELGEPMELAVNAPAEVRDRLTAGGWRLADPRIVTRTPATYQTYVQSSRAEFSVAQHAYVSTRSGWFSDRTVAYLASGRPAVVQDTGFSRFLPCGQGLLGFRSPAEARAAIRTLAGDLERHARAARAIVEEHFDATRVLTALLESSL